MLSYTYEYKNQNGTTDPISLREWAVNNLSADDLAKFNEAMVRQYKFKQDIESYCYEYSSYTNDTMTQIINPDTIRSIDDFALYRFYNFVGAFVNYELARATEMYNVSLSSIDETLLGRYKHNLMARGVVKQVTWYLGELDTAGVHKPVVFRILRFNGTPEHARELELDIAYPGLFDSPMVFPDMDWEKYLDMFLSDPNVIIV